MIVPAIHIPFNLTAFNDSALQKGIWLTILHAERVPPHVGLMIDSNYNSLTIKERELNIERVALVKTISQRKIKSLFLKVKPHPVFSTQHLLEMLQENVLKYGQVKQHENSCLSPVRDFFNEFYAFQSPNTELLFDFVKRLNENHYLTEAMTVNMDFESGITLPFYTIEDLNERILKERQAYFGN